MYYSMERHGMAYSVALFSGTEQVRVKISYIYIVCHILLAASSGLNLILVKVHWIDSPMLHCFLFFYLFFPILVKVKYKNCSAPENNATECHRICHSVPCRGIIKTRAYTIKTHGSVSCGPRKRGARKLLITPWSFT